MIYFVACVARVWLRDSWNYYDSLAHSADADAAGGQIISGAQFHSSPSPVSIPVRQARREGGEGGKFSRAPRCLGGPAVAQKY